MSDKFIDIRDGLLQVMDDEGLGYDCAEVDGDYDSTLAVAMQFAEQYGINKYTATAEVDRYFDRQLQGE
jgi:hypothetical protein